MGWGRQSRPQKDGKIPLQIYWTKATHVLNKDYIFFLSTQTGWVFIGGFLVNGRRMFLLQITFFFLFFLAIALTRKDPLTACGAPDGIV